MNFNTLEGLVQGHLLGRMERNAASEATSLTVYKCVNGHQAVKVSKGPDNYGPLERVLPNGACPVCLGQRGEIVRMN